jgi:phycobilisome rod-core linker protein
VRRYQAGDLDKKVIRQAIPMSFLNMAQGMAVPQLNSQRDVARAMSSAIKIPDSTRDATTVKPMVKPVAVKLPYRYLPSNPKN